MKEIKMKISVLRFVLGIISSGVALFATGCGCPDLVSESTVEPRVREATITRFEPSFDQAQNLPSPQYSIHTFAFPANINSSGSLPNDFRVSDGKEIVLASLQFSSGGNDYTAALTTQVPTNGTLTGDIMIVSVDRINRRACVRFAGDLSSIGKGFNSGSAADYANHLKTLLNPPPGQVPAWQKAASQYGKGSPGTNLCNISNQQTLKVFDGRGNSVVPLPTIPSSVTDSLYKVENVQAVEVEVAVGDIYYYKARNGIEFAVLIEDIFEGSLLPNLQRMTIKFTEIKGPSCDK
ncbi:MAG: hypothetical protein LC116_00750 [Bacteroidetes bacterium]|nr:hypothetical protein [Bacteroidota bacterium]MCZ2131715.1 hypothetical protein [Bacteroidota bacterium]